MILEKLINLVPKSFDPTINRVVAWFYRRKLKKARYALDILLANKDPELYKDLAIAADSIARGLCMNWLDARRINHCYICPNTEPLIRRNEGGYICAGHARVGAQVPFGIKPQTKPGIILGAA